MLNPFLTLIVAGAMHGPAEDAFRSADLSAIVIHLAETAQLAPEEFVVADETPTVRDVPYYYDDFSAYVLPEAPLIVTYDWRLPIFFDLP